MAKKRILVVSQEEYVRGLLQKELREEGYEVLLADTMEKAGSKSRERSPSMVLVDMILSDFDRAEVLRTFQRRKSPLFSAAKPPFPILVWSAYDSNWREFPDTYFVKTANFFKIKTKIKEFCPMRSNHKGTKMRCLIRGGSNEMPTMSRNDGKRAHLYCTG